MSKFPNANLVEVIVEAAMVKLAHRMAPHLTGYSHLQTNPKYSFDTKRTLSNARRYVVISKDLDPSFDTAKLCIKIPATWEGFEACRELEKEGITSLATAVTSMQQAMLASHAGCTYIGCYINELRVHFDKLYEDKEKSFRTCGLSQRLYQTQAQGTQVVAASLTSIHEVMMLAGINHITVSPLLLQELDKTPADSWEGAIGSVFENTSSEAEDVDHGSIEEEAAWRLAFSMDQGGRSEAKLNDAIKLFSEKQESLENLVRSYI
ncbi:hypothetical protein ONZ43_g4987 [Nemania bipapillata]|uniref:Uncharacterized protein n=1 Tax=Nemania bipapillata TaxID=110536 RepID=A0ACC2IG44_9PEZI|nr:hypothetical protein ONZ43_g4987 [Nemania bipapillata]